MEEETYTAGIDIGSTTAKLVVFSRDRALVHKAYCCHYARPVETLREMLSQLEAQTGNIAFHVAFTGSASIDLAGRIGLPFVQEVAASANYVRERHPEVRSFLEIGGEDAKVVFFDEEFHPQIRMNGSCAGGTGAFIEQMAVLLDTPLEDFDKLAQASSSIYPIASRCGVFAKTDLQSLLSNHVAREDIAASVFHAVALQVVASLIRGTEIKRKVLLAGGPFRFFSQLRKAVMEVLKLDAEDMISSPYPEVIAASGAALFSSATVPSIRLGELQGLLGPDRSKVDTARVGLPPLFLDGSEKKEWERRHERFSLPRCRVSDLLDGPCFLGIDSGSTTTKMVLIDENKRIGMSYYTVNGGDSLNAVNKGMAEFLDRFCKAGATSAPPVARTAATGYGEALISAAFGMDDEVVETVAHYRAARSLVPQVSFILDIGGQDMKAIYVRDGAVADVEMNEACSSGCGSFIETFSRSLGYAVADFACLACECEKPFDLGTRCTVFMNSRVREALREGATVAEISAGLAYSVVRNSLYKVLKLRDNSLLGEHILVQGGTFCNPAVLRALELLLKREVARPDMAEMMGAYGAALTALDNYGRDRKACSRFKGIAGNDGVEKRSDKAVSCRGCENTCQVNILSFPTGLSYVSGNRCERYFHNGGRPAVAGQNLIDWKLKLLFERPYKPEGRCRATFGIPRVLNIYENFPFWCTFLVSCGFRVLLSSPSTSGLFEKGVDTVMSDSICFPAKLAHGHIIDLMAKGVDRIFYPAVVYEAKEYPGALNSYNCPIITGYPDVMRAAIDPEGKGLPLDAPAITFRDEALLKKQLDLFFRPLGVPQACVAEAMEKAILAQKAYRSALRQRTEDAIERAKSQGNLAMVLAGRPYHIDPLINHGVAELLSRLGVTVVPEDGLPQSSDLSLTENGVLTQWAYTNRLIHAAKYVAQGHLEGMIQLTSFGCGLDALAADAARDIIASAGRVYSLIKMDEIMNPAAVRIRLRALVEAVKERAGGRPPLTERRTKRAGATALGNRERIILAPWFSPYYSPFLPGIFEHFGYKFELLPPPERSSVEIGLKYVNNDLCYPAVLVIGDVIRAMQYGKYDPESTSVMLTQTFGQCRASNYLPLMRKALQLAGFGEVPVLSLTAGDGNLHFELDADRTEFLRRLALGLIFSDALARMLLATQPREHERGVTTALYSQLSHRMTALLKKGDFKSLLDLLHEAVDAFNRVEVDTRQIPVIGIVGEIFVKYHPFSNQHMVEWFIDQGVEVVLPSLVGFFTQRFVSEEFNQSSYLKRSWKGRAVNRLLDLYVRHHLHKVEGCLRNFRFYRKNYDLSALAQEACRVTSLTNQAGEGWLLTAEMIAMLRSDISHIICLQPFGCLANQITGKGMERKLKALYPRLNLLFLDMDAGASEVNVLNRLQLMLASLRKDRKIAA